MPSLSEVREVVEGSNIAFEIEGRVLGQDGHPRVISAELVQRLMHGFPRHISGEEPSPVLDMGQITQYGALEFKTRLPTADVQRAIEEITVLRKMVESTTGIELAFDARLQSPLWTPDNNHPAHDISTQLQLDLAKVRQRFFSELSDEDFWKIAERVVYAMQSSMPSAIARFCYSPRIATLLQSGMLGERCLPLPIRLKKNVATKMGGVVLRPELGTIEVCTPDSTFDPEQLMNIADYSRGRLAKALRLVMRHPHDTLPDIETRANYRRALIARIANNHHVA